MFPMPCFPNEEEEEQDVASSSSWESQEGCGDWGGGQMDELSEELSSNSPRIHEPRYKQVGCHGHVCIVESQPGGCGCPEEGEQMRKARAGGVLAQLSTHRPCSLVGGVLSCSWSALIAQLTSLGRGGSVL